VPGVTTRIPAKEEGFVYLLPYQRFLVLSFRWSQEVEPLHLVGVDARKGDLFSPEIGSAFKTLGNNYDSPAAVRIFLYNEFFGFNFGFS